MEVSHICVLKNEANHQVQGKETFKYVQACCKKYNIQELRWNIINIIIINNTFIIAIITIIIVIQYYYVTFILLMLSLSLILSLSL